MLEEIETELSTAAGPAEELWLPVTSRVDPRAARAAAAATRSSLISPNSPLGGMAPTPQSLIGASGWFALGAGVAMLILS
jgi:hypothetical protein